MATAGERKLTPEPGSLGKASSVAPAPESSWSGRRIGNGYLLRRPLGRRASVWFAIDRHGGPVALKSGSRRLLLAEHSTVSRLAHPHILRVREFIDTESACFSVGEYLSGGDFVSLAGLHPRHWIGKLAELISALSYLHDRGLVHRDLKPRNVMLDENDRVRLIDFGSAESIGRPWRRGGTTVIAPMRGRGPVDAIDDVYALASLVHEMLYGTLPGAAPRHSPPVEAGELADIVDRRLSAPFSEPIPDLARFAAVVKSMDSHQRVLQ